MELNKEQMETIARMAREWVRENTTLGNADEQEAAAAYIEGARVAEMMLTPEMVRLRGELFKTQQQLNQAIENTDSAINWNQTLQAKVDELIGTIKGKDTDARLMRGTIESLEKEVDSLKQWKASAIKLYSPAENYVQEHVGVFGLRPGDSVQERILHALKVVVKHCYFLTKVGDL